jgi:ABC-type transporter Mla MlaB component
MDERVDVPATPTHGTAAAGSRVEVEVHRSRTGLLLQIRGDLVSETAAELRRQLAGALPADLSGRRVAVDLSRVSAVTAPGLDVVLDVQSRLVAAGGRLELLAPSPAVILLLHDAAAN